MRNKLFLGLCIVILLILVTGLFLNNQESNSIIGYKTDNDCVRAGCSGELCTLKGSDVNTACLYLPEYQCLKYLPCLYINNTCEFQENDDHLNCLDNLKR